MFKRMYDILRKAARSYSGDERGVTAMVFALCVPALIGAAGIAVDLAQAYNVKTRLGNALDKAALAAGSTAGSTEEIEAVVRNFFDANYPAEKLGVPYDIDVVLEDGVVGVSAVARVHTTFMSILGYDYLDIHEESEVVRELAGVEVVLVLDVTGSMAGSKLTALKNAVCSATSSSVCRSNSFLDIMFSRIDDTNYLKIGIVPFSQSVNVGRYGLGLTPSGAAYGPAFVNRPATDDYISPASNIGYSASGANNNWMGCIAERATPADTTDASSPNWGMYRYPRVCSSWRNGTCRSYSNNNPNTGCLTSRVVPMTNVPSTLKSSIYNLVAEGNTYGNVGMAWGWRLISPAEPFAEGVAYDDPDWSKTVVMMTDGDNVSGTMSAYGYGTSPSANTLDSRFLTVCDNMKDEGITIYTIAFDSGSGINNDTKEMLEACASGADHYYDAGTDDIAAAFEDIANHLSQLHITK